MAVAYVGQVLRLGAAADAVTGRIKIQAIVLDHTAAAAANLTDTAGNVIASLRTTAEELTKEIIFPCPIIVHGVIAQALSAGTLTLYTV